MTRAELKAIRAAVADYMRSEGCGCCGDADAHKEAEAVLGRLLRVPRYDDGSGYNFPAFRSQTALRGKKNEH